MLPTLRRLSNGNRRGTYFSRLVAFPGPGGPVNQLDAIIIRLRSENAKKNQAPVRLPPATRQDSPRRSR